MAYRMEAMNVDPNVINPFENQTIIKHGKFISHMGVAFVDLKTTTKDFMSRRSRTVLRNISGQFNYGTLNIILGPKNSGKRTLLNTLSGRNNEAIDPDSLLFVNGDVPPRAVFLDKNVEFNILLDLTIEELLEYAFRFRNPNTGPPECAKVVNDLLNNFELCDVRDLELSYCNQEEQIKAQVAMTLVTLVDRPNLIFIDEPLKDLDSVGMENIIVLFKKLCRLYSVAITLSVGQILNSDYLLLFDKTYVLSQGGLCIYEGSVEHLRLFLRESGVIIASELQTPMERLLKIASKPSQLTLKLADQDSSIRNNILHLAHKYGVPAPDGIPIVHPKVTFRQILDLFGRSYLTKARRHWKSLLASMALIVTFTLALTTAFDDDIGQPSGCFNRTGNRTLGRLVIYKNKQIDQSILREVDLRDEIDLIERKNLVDENVKFVFVITTGMTLFQIAISLRGMTGEVRVAINEHRNGWVNISSFYLVKNSVDLVLPLVNTFSSVFISYFVTGQILESWRFLAFLAAQLLGVICAQSFSYVIGVIGVFNNRFTRMTVLMAIFVLISFSGYLIPMAQIEPWMIGIAHLSFMKLSFELTLISLYGMQRCEQLHYTNSYVMDEFSIDYDKAFWRNSIIILVHLLVYRCTFWAILFVKSNKRNTIRRQPKLLEESDQMDDEDEVEEKYEKTFKLY